MTSQQRKFKTNWLLVRFISCAALLLTLAHFTSGQTSTCPDPAELRLNEPIKRKALKDRHDCYQITVEANQFFQVKVNERDVQVLIKLRDKSNRELAEMQGPDRNNTVEVLSYIPSAAGVYKVEVIILEASDPSAEYTIHQEAQRAATVADERRIKTERLFAEGAAALDTEGQDQPAIQKFSAALAGWNAAHDTYMSSRTISLLNEAHARALFHEAQKLMGNTDRPSKRLALAKFTKAASLYHEAGIAFKEAIAFFGAAQTAEDLREFRLERDFFKRVSPPLFSDPGEAGTRGLIFDKIAKLSLFIDDPITAIKYFTLALALPTYDLQEAGKVLSDIGALHFQLGNYSKALEFLDQARGIQAGGENKCLLSATLVNIGAVERTLSQWERALATLNQSLKLHGTTDECSLTQAYAPPASSCPEALAATFINMGENYYDLKQYQKSECCLKRAAGLTKNNGFQAAIQYDLGLIDYATGDTTAALNQFQEAKDRYLRSRTVNALIQEESQRRPAAGGNAAGMFRQTNPVDVNTLTAALRAAEALGHPRDKPTNLTQLAEIDNKVGQPREALALLNQALPLFRAADDSIGEANALVEAMTAWRALGNRRMAIFFGKLSVNKFQQLRANAHAEGVEVERTFLAGVRKSYQTLAELLIEDGSLIDAIRVLNLYRDQQALDQDLKLDLDDRTVVFSNSEKAFIQRYDEVRNEQRELRQQIDTLVGEVSVPTATPEQLAKLTQLEDMRNKVIGRYALITADAARKLPISSSVIERPVSTDSTVKLIDAQRNLGSAPGFEAVTLYTLLSDQNLYVLALAKSDIKVFSRHIAAGQLTAKADEFLLALRCPELDPNLLGAQIYDAIFKSSSGTGGLTLESFLQRYKPRTLIWSLDGALRQIPMAALYDGAKKQFLVENYQTAIFTRSDPETFTREPRPLTSGIGLGTSKQFDNFRDIPGTEAFLIKVFGDNATNRPGILEGRTLLNGEFRASSLEGLAGQWPLVHIVSHFAFREGETGKSYLKLGDGKDFTLSEMAEQRGLFRGVELLAIPICDTAVDKPDPFGKEIDSFADLAQRLGAKSVIASLWRVPIFATPAVMTRFYELAKAHPDWPKSELLRQAQLSALRGQITAHPEPPAQNAPGVKIDNCPDDRKARKSFVGDPRLPLAHPYYWAGLVIYGTAR